MDASLTYLCPLAIPKTPGNITFDIPMNLDGMGEMHKARNAWQAHLPQIQTLDDTLTLRHGVDRLNDGKEFIHISRTHDQDSTGFTATLYRAAREQLDSFIQRGLSKAQEFHQIITQQPPAQK